MVLAHPYRFRKVGGRSYGKGFLRAWALTALIVVACVSAYPQSPTSGRVPPLEMFEPLPRRSRICFAIRNWC